jgi:O-antigen/teichoic acid export membrane protein
MVVYSLGNYVVGIFGSAPGLIFPLLIVEILSPEETAYFSISWMIAYLLFTVPIAISTSLFAEGSNLEYKFKENIKKAIEFIALLLSIGIIILLIASYDILAIGFGLGYAENGAEVLRLFAISSIPVAVNSVYTAIKRVEKKVREITIIYGFIAIGTIGIGYMLLESFGLIGIPIAWIITQTCAMFASLVGIYRFYRYN